MKYSNPKSLYRETPNINIMVRQTLSLKFNIKQWKQICMNSCQIFHQIQKYILDIILTSEAIFKSKFHLFYDNHRKLYHWYLLANQKQFQIKKYVNFELLKSGIDYYSDKIIQNIMKNQPKQSQYIAPQSQISNKTLMKKQSNELSVMIFDYVRKKYPMKRYQSMQSFTNTKKELDFHQLYVKTFNACDGSKYICYDFQKHMKGIKQKNKYNDFIRTIKQKNLQDSFSENKENYSPQISNSNKISMVEMKPFGMPRIQKKLYVSRRQKIVLKLPNRFGRVKTRDIN